MFEVTIIVRWNNKPHLHEFAVEAADAHEALRVAIVGFEPDCEVMGTRVRKQTRIPTRSQSLKTFAQARRIVRSMNMQPHSEVTIADLRVDPTDGGTK